MDSSTFDLAFELTPKEAAPGAQPRAPPANLRSVEEELNDAKNAEANQELRRMREERAAALAQQKEFDDALARRPPARPRQAQPAGRAGGLNRRAKQGRASATVHFTADGRRRSGWICRPYSGDDIHDIDALDQNPLAISSPTAVPLRDAPKRNQRLGRGRLHHRYERRRAKCVRDPFLQS